MFNSEKSCRLKNDCAYTHKKSVKNQELEVLKDKVNILEGTVSEMMIKLNELTNELKEIKNSKVTKEHIDKTAQNCKKKEDVNEDTLSKNEGLKKLSNKEENLNVIKRQKSKTKETKNSVFIFGAEARKSLVEKKKSEESDKLSKAFKCDLCDYRCEKSTTLKKHMNTKHTKQKCSMCSVEFKTSIDLLSHVAREHHDEEEVRLQSTPKSDSKQEKPDFVFSESMLDEFLV